MITIILSAIILGVQVSPAVENNDTNFEYIEKSNEINTYVGIDFVKSGTMIASWYGPKLPFGTMLRVTNPQNGKQVVVRINDRGPYIKGRDLDLSKGAALQLGMIEKGVIKVEIEKLVPQYSSI
jgi:rare lipoprotein A